MRPEILDIEARQIWPADMVEEGLFVKSVRYDHTVIRFTVGIPDQMDDPRGDFLKRGVPTKVWYLRATDDRELDYDAPLRVVRGMTLWPGYRPVTTRERTTEKLYGNPERLARARSEMGCRDFEVSKAEMPDPFQQPGHVINWRVCWRRVGSS